MRVRRVGGEVAIGKSDALDVNNNHDHNNH
jgi:hypothetical protein